MLSCEFCEIFKNTFLKKNSGRLLLSLAESVTDRSNLKGGIWLDKSDDHINTGANAGNRQCSGNWQKTIYHEILGKNALEKQKWLFYRPV